jgi:hypothetical protein
MGLVNCPSPPTLKHKKGFDHEKPKLSITGFKENIIIQKNIWYVALAGRFSLALHHRHYQPGPGYGSPERAVFTVAIFCR